MLFAQIFALSAVGVIVFGVAVVFIMVLRRRCRRHSGHERLNDPNMAAMVQAHSIQMDDVYSSTVTLESHV